MADSPLTGLIGTWEFEIVVEGRSMGRGRATFEWIEDGAFVLERSEAEWSDPGWVENAPVSTRAVFAGRSVFGEPSAFAKPSRNARACGGSTSRTSQKPLGWSPSGPVMWYSMRLPGVS